MIPQQNNIWLHRFAVLTAAATLALIGIGGLVTSHGAGMSVPDWPTSYGYNMFALPFEFWKGGIFYEHTHRLWASEVGLLTMILMFWLFGRKSRPAVRWVGLALLLAGAVTFLRGKGWQAALHYGLHGAAMFGASFVWPRCEPSSKWLRRLGVIAFIAVVFQGVLGGLRVTLFKDELGIFHGALAQLFFVLLCSIALFTSSWWKRINVGSSASMEHLLVLRRFFLFTTILIFVQLILGATMRHQHAGLAIPDFPLAYGKLWPAMDPESIARYNQQRQEVSETHAITAAQIGLQMAHRIVAVVILAAVAMCAIRATRLWGWKSPLARLSFGWLGLILLQAVLGVATILSNKAADVATGHVLVGALSLMLGSMLVLVLRRMSTKPAVESKAEISASQFSFPVGQTAAPTPIK